MFQEKEIKKNIFQFSTGKRSHPTGKPDGYDKTRGLM